MQPAQRVKASGIGRNGGGRVVDLLFSASYPSILENTTNRKINASSRKRPLQTELYGVKMTAHNMLTPELRILVGLMWVDAHQWPLGMNEQLIYP